ncbi:MAG: hypothetical protein M1823_002000 [Watsoniomyces obsoletus]|nr:MAG: hypothetical protein M1823_002000 [Watsoniomyces obsoletus]
MPPPPANQEPASTSSSSSSNGGSQSSKDDFNLFDTTSLKQSIEKAKEKFTHDLSQLKPGGRFNPGILEGLKVELPSSLSTSGTLPSSREKDMVKEKGFMKRNGTADGKGTTASMKVSAKLGDLAQVIPRGRMIVVMVSEKEHIKPILKSIQSSNLNLTPVLPSSASYSSSSFGSSSPGASFGTTSNTSTRSSPTNTENNNNNNNEGMEIHIPLPTATKESQNQVLDQAKKFEEKATMMIRDARHAFQKRMKVCTGGSGSGSGSKGSSKSGSKGEGSKGGKGDEENGIKKWSRDDLLKANKMMELEVEKGLGDVKKIGEGARRALEKN